MEVFFADMIIKGEINGIKITFSSCLDMIEKKFGAETKKNLKPKITNLLISKGYGVLCK